MTCDLTFSQFRRVVHRHLFRMVGMRTVNVAPFIPWLTPATEPPCMRIYGAGPWRVHGVGASLFVFKNRLGSGLALKPLS